MTGQLDFQPLLDYLKKLPAADPSIGSGTGTGEGSLWWVKFIIDVDHPMAWRIVQELGHVLNYVLLNKRLPTIFMPVSPPPYMNGGPRDFLSWVIESRDPGFTPADCAEWLEGRLPRPVDDPEQWKLDEE
jgi:hypothetical protein